MSDHCGSVEYFVMVGVVSCVEKSGGCCGLREEDPWKMSCEGSSLLVVWRGVRWGTDFCTEWEEEEQYERTNNVNDATSLI
jgi:hypothetical protein